MNTTPVHLHSTVPVLPVPDIAEARAFYSDKLGFTVDFEAGDCIGVTRDEAPIRTTPWGSRQFSVRDCCGNRLTFVRSA